jgi:hypothetical protein
MGNLIKELNLDMDAHFAGFRQQWDVAQVRIITLDGTDIGWLQSFLKDETRTAKADSPRPAGPRLRPLAIGAALLGLFGFAFVAGGDFVDLLVDALAHGEPL